MSDVSSQRPYVGTWAWVSSARVRTSYMKSETHSSAKVAPKGCIAWSGGFSFIKPSRSLAVRAMRGSAAASSSVGGGIGCAASHWSRGRATGSRPSSIDRRLVPVRGSPTMIQGLSMRSSCTSGCSTDQLRSAIRFARADASIFEMRRRPKVVSAASSSQARRNTSSGSRNESLPKSSDPAILVAAFTTAAGLSDGRSRPTRPSRSPIQLKAWSGRLRNSASRHVYSTSLIPRRPSRCRSRRSRPRYDPRTDAPRARRGRSPPPPW